MNFIRASMTSSGARRVAPRASAVDNEVKPARAPVERVRSMAIQSPGSRRARTFRPFTSSSPALPVGPRLYRYTGRWTGNRWVHAESALTHFNEFPFRAGPLYRKFPARLPRKLSRRAAPWEGRKEGGIDFLLRGNFYRWRVTARASGKLYFPRTYVPTGAPTEEMPPRAFYIKYLSSQSLSWLHVFVSYDAKVTLSQRLQHNEHCIWITRSVSVRSRVSRCTNKCSMICVYSYLLRNRLEFPRQWERQFISPL